MTGLRNLRAIINESFIRIKGRQGKENRCECALNGWLGVRRGWEGRWALAWSFKPNQNKKRKKERKRGKKGGNEGKKRGAPATSKSLLKIKQKH